MSFFKWYNRGEQLYPQNQCSLAGSGQYTKNPGEYNQIVNPKLLMMKKIQVRIINRAVREAARLRIDTIGIVGKTSGCFRSPYME